MFKNLILATATAAVALTAAADFSAGTFDMTAAAEARSAGVLAQTQLKPTKPTAPSRTPSVQPSEPTTGRTPILQPAATIDLSPEPVFPTSYEGSPGYYYCTNLWGGNPLPTKIMFYLHNGGNTNSGPVKAVVEFKGAKSITKQVAAVPAGAGGALHVDIPANAWQSGTASFTIRVDPQNQVAESNEHNNVVSSFCTGPAG